MSIELLQEGVHDKSIFKAVFINGAPGSGKDYVIKNALTNHGLVEVDADKLHKHLHDKSNNFDSPSTNKKMNSVADLRQLLAVHGRNGLLINGSGEDHIKTKEIKKKLDRLGYDSSMIHVHVDDEESKRRNIERSKNGSRVLPETKRSEKWNAVQKARQHHANLFGQNYHEFDNSADLRSAPPNVLVGKQSEMQGLSDKIKTFIDAPVDNEKSQKWKERETTGKNLSSFKKGTSKLPHPVSNAANQAKELGLQYYGTGKYGKNGKITHHSISDNLVEIEKEKPVKKKINENVFDDILSEAVSLTVKADSKLELIDLISSLVDNDKKDSSNNFSDKCNLLMLGKPLVKYGESIDQHTETILIEEKENVKKNFFFFKENLLNPRSSRIITESSTEEKKVCICEETEGLKKKTLSLYRKESIDKGIEPGLSMASSGENLLRKKDKNKESCGVELSELTGDETLKGISDMKEDELKKAGITLASFKAKGVV